MNIAVKRKKRFPWLYICSVLMLATDRYTALRAETANALWLDNCLIFLQKHILYVGFEMNVE